MVLSKSEMEDIWHNKPVNYLKVLKQKMKGAKMYRVNLTPIKYEKGETEVFEVRAKTKADAEFIAKNEYTKKHGAHSPDAWRISSYTV
jgi:hypothetical protein